VSAVFCTEHGGCGAAPKDFFVTDRPDRIFLAATPSDRRGGGQKFLAFVHDYSLIASASDGHKE
jgi:hypothetical protein